MYTRANELGLIEVGMTAAAFAMCALVTAGPVVGIVTAALVLVAISLQARRSIVRRRTPVLNRDVTVRNVAFTAPSASNGDRVEQWPAA